MNSSSAVRPWPSRQITSHVCIGQGRKKLEGMEPATGALSVTFSNSERKKKKNGFFDGDNDLQRAYGPSQRRGKAIGRSRALEFRKWFFRSACRRTSDLQVLLVVPTTCTCALRPIDREPAPVCLGTPNADSIIESKSSIYCVLLIWQYIYGRERERNQDSKSKAVFSSRKSLDFGTVAHFVVT